MSANEQPAHYHVFETYFTHNYDTASLCDFVTKNAEYIINHTTGGENMKAVWNKRYQLAYKHKYGVEPSRSSTQRSPDWSTIALKFIETLNHQPSATPSRTPTSSESNATNTTKTAAPVSPEFIQQFKDRHSAMKDSSKWKLPSGKYVEDVMFDFGLTCTHEHPAHSFILDINDPVWLTAFPNSSDRRFIVESQKKELPASSARLDEYLESYIGKTTFDDLMDHARSKVFSFKNDFEMDWAQSTMETAVRLYPAKVIPLTDRTESDILKRIWVFIDKAFDDVPVDVRSGEMESTSSSMRRNNGRDIADRKLHGHKADLLMRTAQGEYGCCEAGRLDNGAEGTKEKYEAGLKEPKMLKDMTWALATSANTDELLMVGLIISGLKIFALLMDRPSTYICRLTRTCPMYFPSSVDDFATGMGTLIRFISQVKQVIMATYHATKPKTIQNATIENCLVLPEQLPPCATSPKLRPAKRQKTSSSTSTTSASS